MIVLYILIIAHFLADFTFQPAEMALEKTRQSKFLAIHSLIYAVIFFIAMLSFSNFRSIVLPYCLIVISHFLIDWIRIAIDKKSSKKVIVFLSFLLDQFLHISILVLLFIFFRLSTSGNQLYNYIQEWEFFNKLIVYIFIFVTIWDPAAVFIKKLFAYIISDNTCADEENDPQIGRVIGKLERVIIAALVLCNQFGAIGFVLAAKSIARFQQLEDRNFAEKYLVGTLTSTCIAVITTLIFQHLI